MLTDPAQKYRPISPVDLADRQWPSRTLAQAPIWLSTDLRDGNQALFEPMNRERKLRLFHELVRIGFKEIEVGFPAASRTDFEIVRHLIDAGQIPEDVTPMVMTQLRDDLITETVRSVAGTRRVKVSMRVHGRGTRRAIFIAGWLGTAADWSSCLAALDLDQVSLSFAAMESVRRSQAHIRFWKRRATSSKPRIRWGGSASPSSVIQWAP